MCQYHGLCCTDDTLSDRNCNSTARQRNLSYRIKTKRSLFYAAKLYDLECQKRHDAEAEARKSQIGTGDRSEKIRTYNFPQGRVTDHRINLTLYKLDKILNGDIQEIIDACIAADQAKKLSNMEHDA